MGVRSLLLTLTGMVLCGLRLAYTEEEEKRPAWDQKRALELVHTATELEKKKDLPWDHIPWLSDADEAVAKARKEQKPLFVYFYLQKGGPAAAPC